MKRFWTLVWLVLTLGLPLSGHGTLIVNGGFETGDLTGWVSNDVLVADNLLVPVSSGTYAAAFTFGGSGPGLGVLYQDIATTIGQSYDLSFDFTANGEISKTAALQVEVIGASTLVNLTLFDNPPVSYAPYAYGFVADSTTTRIRFTDVSTDTLNLDAALDNVTVIPEPGSILYIGIAFSGLMLLKRIRSNITI